MIFPHCLLNNFPLFHACHKAVVNAKRYSVSVGKVGEYSSFFCTCRIFRNRPAGLIEVSADIVVSVKLDYSRNSAVKKVLCADNFKLFVRQIFLFSSIISHAIPPNQIRFLPHYRGYPHPICLSRSTVQAYV